MDENLELDLLHQKPNVAVEDDVLKRNISRKMTLEEVCCYIHCMHLQSLSQISFVLTVT